MFLNISDPGILHQGELSGPWEKEASDAAGRPSPRQQQCDEGLLPLPNPLPMPGSNEQGPRTVRVVWAKHIAFRLQWCPQCCFHRPPRTYHCPWCNICVEDFDHHCRWVNNCIGHRNLGLFILLLLCLCLYLGSMLVTCMVFLLRTTHLPFSIDKVIAYPPGCRVHLASCGQGEDSRRAGSRGRLVGSIVVVVPAAGFLVPLLVLLLMKARSVSTAQRSYEDKVHCVEGLVSARLRIRYFDGRAWR
ncbi:palmitoyltransferase ZDHHC19-like [Diceros bicornis minor]|uniref:palmitoyltransferase ZDHHC19-like n=1 Tax=Diceros bicornis minor TaxID=77932 RepID=UPI0026EC32DC|nr:palmitoyltransferase ZDHHC19-like [Diceros bicornis minor]